MKNLIILVFIFSAAYLVCDNTDANSLTVSGMLTDTTVQQLPVIEDQSDTISTEYIETVLIKMSPVHCARGPQACDKCKEYAKQNKYCLLGLLHRGGDIARPMIELDLAGIKTWYEFDQLKIFENDEEALKYAEENKIRIVKKEE